MCPWPRRRSSGKSHERFYRRTVFGRVRKERRLAWASRCPYPPGTPVVHGWGGDRRAGAGIIVELLGERAPPII